VNKLIFIVFLTGCGVTEATRELTYQNYDAGKQIVEAVSGGDSDKAIQAATDVTANSEAVMADIGPPEAPQPYSKQESNDARERQKEELRVRRGWTSVFSGVVDWASGNIPWLTTIIGFITTGITVWQKGKVKSRLFGVYEGFDNVMNKAKEKGVDSVILDAMTEVTSAKGVYKDIRKEVRKLRQKGELSNRNHSEKS